MKRIARGIHSMLDKVLVLCSFALIIPLTTLAAFDTQEGSADQRRSIQDFLRYTPIDYPGALGTSANGINDYGVIVGQFIDAIGVHGFVLENGVFKQIDFPGAAFTQALGINNLGHIVGQFSYDPSTNVGHGFLLKEGVFTTIDPPGATTAEAAGINDYGEITGAFRDNNGTQHGYLWKDGAFQTFDSLQGTTIAEVADINNLHQIVGSFVQPLDPQIIPPELTRGFLRDEGIFTPIDHPQGPNTIAYGINDHGQIVGIYGVAFGQEQGFLLDNGVFKLIVVLGATATDAYDINNNNQIVGLFFDNRGVGHGFLAE
jgi:probable HAF family extracellular repeat protein